MSFYQLIREQKLKVSVDEIWDFISAPQNLKEITPDYMGFDITSRDLPKEMYQGMIISYEVSPMLGIKTDWVTEITHIKAKEFFVDEQRVGPYSLWHHQHILKPYREAVIMKDIVTYKPPMGFLGSIANALFIRRQLNEIFDYRKKAIAEIYDTYE